MHAILNAFARLALGLWVGAVAAATLVAFRAFGFLETPERAGEFMAPIFRKIDLFGVGAAVLVTFAVRRSRWRAILAGFLGAGALVNAFGLAPRIAERADRWETYHRISEGIWGCILVGGALLLLAGMGSGEREKG